MTEQLSLSLHYMGRVLGNPKQLQHACLGAYSVMSDCDPFDCRPPGSVLSVLRIFQARILEQVAIFFSRGFFQSRDRTRISSISSIDR